MKLFVKWALVALACSALVVGCGNKNDDDDDEEETEDVVVVHQ